MAGASTNFEENDDDEYNGVISRQEVQAAIAKAVELRAIHASLLQGINNNNNSPANFIKFPPHSSSSSSPAANLFSAQDYPIFTPVSSLLIFNHSIFCIIGSILEFYKFSFFFKILFS